MAFDLVDDSPELYILVALYNGSTNPFRTLNRLHLPQDAQLAAAETLSRYKLAARAPWRITSWGEACLQQHAAERTGKIRVSKPPPDHRLVAPIPIPHQDTPHVPQWKW